MSGTMTAEFYYVAVKRLGLRPTNCPTVYTGPDGINYNVPNPAGLPPEVLEGIIRNLREMLSLS